jgi:exosome complex component RRP4
MILFTSFPLQPNDDSYYASRQHHPDAADDVLMDLDDDQELFEAGGSKNLTYPGESLTSSQAYMR